MNPWKRLHNEFRALHEEESRILQDRASGEYCYAYVVHPKSGEFDGWAERFPTEDLQARFELLATEAGIALGSPRETAPLKHWLHQLFLDSRARDSDLIHMYGDNGTIERLFEASMIYCARLDRQWHEKSVMLCETAAEANAAPRLRRGYRKEVRQWMALERLSTLDVAAKRLRISRSALKSIMSDRGKCRYGGATLDRVLETVGHKGE
jgi:hypothetical protein